MANINIGGTFERDRSNTTCPILRSVVNTHRAPQHTATPPKHTANTPAAPTKKLTGELREGKTCRSGKPLSLTAARPTKPGMSKVPEATTCQRDRLRFSETYGYFGALRSIPKPQGWAALQRPGKKAGGDKAGRHQSSGVLLMTPIRIVLSARHKHSTVSW